MEEQLSKQTTALFGVVDKIYQLLVEWGVSPTLSSFLDEIISLSLLILLAYLAKIVSKVLADRVIARLAKFTPFKWDDIFVEHKVAKYLVKVIPAAILHLAAPVALRAEWAILLLQKLTSIYIVYIILKSIAASTKALTEIFSTTKEYANKPVKVLFQIITVFAYFIGAIVIASIAIDSSFTTLFAALGASMAILMLIFKDTILGFVAGWQLSANDMLRIGDWITVPKYGADGDVEEISLYSVKVRNFDKTITTIPPYTLVSESFQNWRGMQESVGRRVKRSIIIDMNSVAFCTPEMLDKFRKIAYLEEYIERTEREIALYNKENNIDNSILVNGRRQTNIGVFRAYLTEFLKRHPIVSKNATVMVRQLQPTEKGIPVELYFFITDKNWIAYENIQSDIFDHVLAITEQFDLKIFQYPTMFN